MKQMIRILLTATALICASSVAFAEEHPVGAIKGTHIDLKTFDHAIAGQVKNFVMWGFVNEETFTSDIILRKDAQLINATFKKQEDGRIGGEIRHTVDNREIVTSLYMVGINKETNVMTLNVNGQNIEVAIIGELKDGHFQNPTYSANINGEAVSFTIDGTACYGFSFHLVAMIFGAYLH